MTIGFGATVGLAALLALAACGGGDEAPRDDGPADVTIQTSDGRAEVRSGADGLSGLPEGIPGYPGADVSAGMRISGADDEGSGTVVSFHTDDSPAQVVAFYREAAERAGFTIAGDMTMGEAQSIVAERGENEGLHVNATPTPEGSQVQIISGTAL